MPLIGRRARIAAVEVVVFTRVGCGLCRAAEALVSREAAGATVRHVDVDSSPQLQERYGVRVPVIEIDGVEVAQLQVAPGSVRAALRSALRRK
jgi:glutaredoxin